MDETARRREIQMRYNEEHGIISANNQKRYSRFPLLFRKARMTDVTEDIPDYNAMTKAERQETIKKLQKQCKKQQKCFDLNLLPQLREVLELTSLGLESEIQ